MVPLALMFFNGSLLPVLSLLNWLSQGTFVHIYSDAPRKDPAGDYDSFFILIDEEIEAQRGYRIGQDSIARMCWKVTSTLWILSGPGLLLCLGKIHHFWFKNFFFLISIPLKTL